MGQSSRPKGIITDFKRKTIALHSKKEKAITILLIASCMISIPVSLILTETIEVKHLVGLFFASASGLAYLYLRRYFRIILLVTLLLGTIDIVQFIFFKNTFGLEVSAFGLNMEFTLQVFSFALLLIFVYTNRHKIYTLLKDVFKEKHLAPEELSSLKEARIESFKTKYRSKSVEELQKISNSPNLFDSHAVEAAMSLLREKNER